MTDSEAIENARQTTEERRAARAAFEAQPLCLECRHRDKHGEDGRCSYANDATPPDRGRYLCRCTTPRYGTKVEEAYAIVAAHIPAWRMFELDVLVQAIRDDAVANGRAQEGQAE